MSDVLKPSDQDTVHLGIAIVPRYQDVMDLYLKTHGIRPKVSADLVKDINLWETMVRRHRSGDVRHTLSESIAIRNVARWTIEINAQLRNQPTPEMPEFLADPVHGGT